MDAIVSINIEAGKFLPREIKMDEKSEIRIYEVDADGSYGLKVLSMNSAELSWKGRERAD